MHIAKEIVNFEMNSEVPSYYSIIVIVIINELNHPVISYILITRISKVTLVTNSLPVVITVLIIAKHECRPTKYGIASGQLL